MGTWSAIASATWGNAGAFTPSTCIVGSAGQSPLDNGFIETGPISIPYGATVSAAGITFTISKSGSCSPKMNVGIPVGDYTFPVDAATASTANTAAGSNQVVENVPSNGTYTFDITALVQAAVSNVGWVSGDSLSIEFIPNNNGQAPSFYTGTTTISAVSGTYSYSGSGGGAGGQIGANATFLLQLMEQDLLD